MSADQIAFLALRNFPARLTLQQAAWFLGFLPADIPALVAARLLKPLGHPARTGSKYFAHVILVLHKNDPAWLAKASDAIVDRWRDKNANRSAHLSIEPLVDSAA